MTISKNNLRRTIRGHTEHSFFSFWFPVNLNVDAVLTLLEMLKLDIRVSFSKSSATTDICVTLVLIHLGDDHSAVAVLIVIASWEHPFTFLGD